ncbi:hypothetical protein K2F43_10760 [Clostridium estertheticum]|uniref:DUF5673 domain-containing protein n=1 Tax=Clostridium estertheticum TaxID=238834 RepID=UPI001C6DD925|nr:DUF5673 domain-containing protein [Clostridium estertheticum]MBW9171692.1 hypothetical protein [Clostridium estertheticum]WLC77181.1 hypothetical protein KTC99_10495 [Clostridium estertheticum]
MDTFTKMFLIINIFAFLIILRKLYIGSHHGKLIITAKKSRFPIFWTIMIIFWFILGILGYYYYTNNHYNFLLDIVWIEISIYNIIRDLHSSEIRENGIYGSGNFYKWSKVQSYSWILPTTIQFEVSPTFFKTNNSFKFIIKEDLKSEVNETVQKFVTLI